MNTSNNDQYLQPRTTPDANLYVDRIVEGDCNRVLAYLPDECVDFVLTDPPYGVNYRDRRGRSVVNDGNLDDVLSAFKAVFRVLKSDRYCVSFYGWPRVDEFVRAWRLAGFRPIAHLVWTKQYATSARYVRACHESAFLLAKGNPVPPAEPLSDVLSWEYTGNRVHPTQKAVGVLRPLVECFTEEQDLVLDPFLGSGTTAVAAALCNRRYLGIEVERTYCECARRRLAAIAQERQRRRSLSSAESQTNVQAERTERHFGAYTHCHDETY